MTESDILGIVNRHAACTYVFAQSISRKWGSEQAPTEHGVFYQLMPSEGTDDFFESYCDHSPYAQFFVSKEACALAFLDKLIDWQNTSS